MAIKRPNWRKTTWIILIWNALMVAWIIGGLASGSNPSNCGTLSQQVCNDAANTGRGIGVAIIVVFWLIGDALLSVIWLVTNRRRRVCPACGRNVKVGETVCKGCNHNFAKQ